MLIYCLDTAGLFSASAHGPHLIWYVFFFFYNKSFRIYKDAIWLAIWASGLYVVPQKTYKYINVPVENYILNIVTQWVFWGASYMYGIISVSGTGLD